MPRTQGITGRPRKVAVEIESSSSDEIIESSSEDSQTDQASAKGRNATPKLHQKPSAKAEEPKVAPNSTTHTAPQIRPSKKRTEFRSKLKRERILNQEEKHRKGEKDLKKQHPKLPSLVQAHAHRKLQEQAENEFEKTHPTLDKATLVAQVKATGGRLAVNVNSKASAEVVARVLEEGLPVKALQLSGWFTDDERHVDMSDQEYMSIAFTPDSNSLHQILFSGHSLEELDLGYCKISEDGVRSLAKRLTCSTHQPIQRLCLRESAMVQISMGARITLISAIHNAPELKELKFHHVLFEGAETYEFIEQSLAFTTNIQTLKFSSVITYEGFPFDRLFRHSKGAYGRVSEVSVAGSELRLPTDEADEYFRTCCEQAKSAKFLRVLDLSDCGISGGDMEIVAAIVQHCPALEEIKADENAVSDATQMSLIGTMERNRKANLEKKEALIKAGTAAFDLLVNNANQAPTLWEPEVSKVLAERSPPELLDTLTKVIGENPDSIASQSKREPSASKKDSPAS